ncbi:MAG: hypothetical protein KDD23_06015 [Winogradskyella sp.]|uniref:hypothetical protein n=1 Tax=Xanthomarina gelatinilytica TaxID=1137281 RepID=UPI001D25E7E9|nr:hypothetical protein [Winogradskyella sp.]
MKQSLLLVIIYLFSFSTFSQSEPNDLVYRRSSLYTLMISDENKEHQEVIQNSFTNYPIPEKFNSHTLEKRTIPKTINDSVSKKELYVLQQQAITDFLTTNDVAKFMVAKWFNRSKEGGFNMNLISERGHYNATDLDVKIARNSERGTALIADAGEELINNTFVVINNFKYTNKEEVAKKTNSILSAVSSVASQAGASDLSLAVDTAAEGVDILGKGYVIKTDSYLYQLVWNDEIASIFYNDYWTEDGNIDTTRVTAFNDSNIFKLQYIGMESAWADLQSTKYTTQSEEELITVATLKASDAVIAKLQRTYEVFRTKTPLLSGDPITAKIGLKEGLEKGDKYEVLEQIINKVGKTEYKQIGVIKVEKNLIWDNRFMATDENESELEYTTFKGSKNKYYQGMLIRQIN